MKLFKKIVKQYGFLTAGVIIGIVISWFLANAIGMFEIPDSYFYITLGTYLFTGRIAYISPFNLVLPQTLFGPVYSIISFILFNHVPLHPLFSVPFFQLLLIVFATALLALVLKKLFPRVWIPFGIILFLILPFSVIYAFFMMSETLTMFLFMLYVAVVVLVPTRSWQRSMLVLIATIMVLTRYAFLPILGISLVFWIAGRPRKIQAYIPALLGILCICWWVGLHIRIFHVPLISTFTGRHLYNNVVTQGGFVPKDHSDPSVAAFFSYVPPYQSATRPWWELQGYFAPPFKSGKYNEVQIDRLFLMTSLEGIKEHPIGYAMHIARLMIITPVTVPFHENVLSQLGFTETNCVLACAPRPCRFTWLPSECRPLKESAITNTLFAYWILINQTMYPLFTSLLEILAVIGMIGMLLTRKPVLMTLAVLFFMQHGFQSASEWVEGRFMLPLYPLYTILILYGVVTISKWPHQIPKLIHSLKPKPPKSPQTL